MVARCLTAAAPSFALAGVCGALEQAARDNARSLPLFIESLLSEHLTAKGYLRKVGGHGIPVSQLNAENDG